uniref:sororin isoform X2 n=1 Tax=Pristiophorus japonicus TaxID=55135 RepID=UPI00398F64A8
MAAVRSDVQPPLRRKSGRLSAIENTESSVPVKRSIVLKKIEPQKNVLKRISGESQQYSKLTTCITTAPRRSPRVSPKATKENVCEGSVRSENAPSSGGGWVVTLPPASAPATSTAQGTGASLDTAPGFPEDGVTWLTQKVRRSYSRLSPFGLRDASGGSSPNNGSDTSTSTPNQPASARRSFFGFERLLASEALPGVSPVKAATPRGKCAEMPGRGPPAAASLVPRDVNIPGVTVAKEKKKKRKVPQIEPACQSLD